MKKTISLLLILVIIFSLVSVTASASLPLPERYLDVEVKRQNNLFAGWEVNTVNYSTVCNLGKAIDVVEEKVILSVYAPGFLISYGEESARDELRVELEGDFFVTDDNGNTKIQASGSVTFSEADNVKRSSEQAYVSLDFTYKYHTIREGGLGDYEGEARDGEWRADNVLTYRKNLFSVKMQEETNALPWYYVAVITLDLLWRELVEYIRSVIDYFGSLFGSIG